MLSGKGYYGYGGVGVACAPQVDQHRRDEDEERADALIEGNRQAMANASTWLEMARDSVASGDYETARQRLVQAQHEIRNIERGVLHDAIEHMLGLLPLPPSPLEVVPLTAHNRSRWP